MNASQVADWMLDRLPADAVPIELEMPPQHEHVLGWVSDTAVAIHHFPLVVWRDGNDEWWGGVPGNYLDLRRLRWEITHWKSIKSVRRAAIAKAEG